MQEIQASSRTPQAGGGSGMEGDQAISSTPRACGLVLHHLPAQRIASTGVRTGLRALDLVAEILEVLGADSQLLNFLDHRQEVSQGANSVQRRCFVSFPQACVKAGEVRW